jgi:hypothetical protein
VAPTLTLTALVASPSAETNTATINHADQFDPDPTNNQGSATVTPGQADLALTKTALNPSPIVGTPFTYTITVTNHGPDAAPATLASGIDDERIRPPGADHRMDVRNGPTRTPSCSH